MAGNRKTCVVLGAVLLLLLDRAPAAAARVLKQSGADPVGDLSVPGEGLCTTLCKWNREALIGVDDIYEGLSDAACIKRCLKTAAVVNPGQCRFYACPATKLKYATAAQCQSACAVQCVALLGVVSDAGSTQDCSREVASFNPGKSR